MSTGEQSTAARMEPGEVIEGKVIELDKSWSDYQSRYVPVVNIRQTDGTLRTVIAFHEMLARKLTDRRPRPGDPIKITCHGERATKDGKRTITLYSVEGGQEPDAEAFWQGIGARDPLRQSGPSGARSASTPDGEEDIPF